jgi:hypothetical protein
MSPTFTTVTGQKAPCGQTLDGQCYEDGDAEALVTHEVVFSCGCRSIRHEYHDGTVGRKTIHHNGKVLLDELDAEWSGLSGY